MSLLGVMTALTIGASAMADAWPWKVERLPDGSLEYFYDLSTLAGTADARETHGDEKVAAFLMSLPKEARLRVTAVKGVHVSAGRGVEPRRLVSSFGAVSASAVRPDNPLYQQPGPTMRMPLHPEQPKLLLSADAVMLAARAVEDGTLASVALETDRVRVSLFSQVLDGALLRAAGVSGDAKEGAVVLAARAALIVGCLEGGRAPAKVRAHAEVAAAMRAQEALLTSDVDAASVPNPFMSTPDLRCAWVRSWVASRPFTPSRAGNAAALTFIDIVDGKPALKALYATLLSRRDAYFGTPAVERLALWRQTAKGDAAGAVDRLSEFLEQLPYEERNAPELIAAATSPFASFGASLSGRERALPVEELAQAVQDGRVELPTARDAPWPALREAALAPWLAAEGAGVEFDALWRDRLLGGFAALMGAHHEVRGDGREREQYSDERTELKVRLMVPPHLEVEPLPMAYSQAAISLERLMASLTHDKLTHLKWLGADGRPEGVAMGELKRWAEVLKGLAKLGAPALQKDGPELKAVRGLLASWRKAPAFLRDVRSASVLPVAHGDERQHTAIVGVARRELAVTFSTPPAYGAVTKGPFEVSTEAEQRYIVPVLHTIGLTSAADQRPLARSTLIQTLERVKNDPVKVEEAVLEALGAAR